MAANIALGRDISNEIWGERVERTQVGVAQFRCHGGDCCNALWEKIQAAVAAIADNPDDVERNRQINTAYANLYMSDPEAQYWAGTASMVSKQAGCFMRGAGSMAGLNDELGKINHDIFSSIYPPLRLYEDGKKRMSPERLRECVLEKTASLMPSGVSKKAFAHLMDGVTQTMNGNGDAAALLIAQYEQKTVAEKTWSTERDLRWATSVSSDRLGFNRDLYLTHACESDNPALTVHFDDDLEVIKADDRIKYYVRDLLPQFEQQAKRPGGFTADMRDIRDRNP